MDVEKNEFFKLDQVDRKLLFWLMDHSPDAILSWLEYTIEEYKKRKNVEIDLRRLRKEIEEEEIDLGGHISSKRSVNK